MLLVSRASNIKLNIVWPTQWKFRSENTRTKHLRERTSNVFTQLTRMTDRRESTATFGA